MTTRKLTIELSEETVFVALAVASCAAWAVVLSAVYAPTPAAWQMSAAQTALLPEILTRLPQGFAAVFPALLFVLSAVAPGHFALRALRLSWANDGEQWLTETAVGLIVLTFAVIVLGEAALLRPAVLLPVFTLCLLGSSWLVYRWWSGNGARVRQAVADAWSRRSPRDLWICAALAFVAFSLYISFLGALVPEHAYDARWYHLAEAKRFAEHHRLFSLLASEHNIQLGLPHYQEILYAALVSVAGLTAAKAFAWADGLLAVLGIAMFAWTHLRSWLVAALAAAVFVDTPIVAWSGTTAATDLPLAFFTLLVVHTFLRWYDDGEARWLLVAGFIGGYTLGVKPFGIFTLAALALIMLIRGRKQPPWRALLMLSTAAFAGFLPWLLVSWADSGNPFFPFFGAVFPSPYLDSHIDSMVRSSYQLWGAAPVTPLGIFLIPWRVVTEVDKYRSVIGPVYLALAPLWIGAPLLFASAKSHLKLVLGFLALWSVLWYYSGALDARYAEAVFPLIAILVAYPFTLPFTTVAARLAQGVAAALLVVAGALNTQFLLPLQKGAELPQVSGAILLPEPFLFAGQSPDQVQLVYMPMVSYMNKTLSPATDKVYDDTELVVFNLYSDIDLFNGDQYDSPSALGQWNLASPDALARLRNEHITHVVTYRSKLAALRASALWPHLRLLHQEKNPVNGNQPAFDEFLFAVTYEARRPPRVTATGST